MKVAAYRLAWAAPLLVGAAAAVAAEVAIGILLYAGPGLMRSLTTVLAVEGAALGAGLWGAPSRGAAPSVDRLRRRWLFCLVSFMAAAFFGTSWSVVQDLGGGPMSQGLGLAVLAALPLYACGLVLGGMSAVSAADSRGGVPGPGAAAALGAALGFMLTGVLLPRAPLPASLLIACVVLLSAGGMIYGIVLSSRPVVYLRAERHAAGGVVRVEDHLRTAKGEAARYLLESGHVRRCASLRGNGAAPWDIVAARGLLESREGAVRVLSLGGGASSLARTLLAERPEMQVDVLERNPAVVDLSREHLDTTAAEGSDRVSVRVGNLEDLLTEARGPYDLVLVDTSALAPLGGTAGLSRSARAALHAAVGTHGVLAAGPLPADPGLAGGPMGWRTAVLRRPGTSPDGGDEVLTVGRPAAAEPWAGAIGDFVRSNGGRSEP
jgi:hypothetical protein